MDARSKRSNLANFNGLEILCPKEVHSYNFLHGFLHLITYLPANMEAKRSVGVSGRVSNSNTCQQGGNMITKRFFGQTFLFCNLFKLFIAQIAFKCTNYQCGL